MIRTTLIGLAAVFAITAAAASSASAGVKVYFGAPTFGGYHGGYYNSYYAPTYFAPCHKVIVGHKTVWTGYGWVHVPVNKKVCGYAY